MKFTLKERHLIKEYVKRILREDFKSDLMRKLNQYNIPIAGRSDYLRDGTKITDILKSLNIRANTITDSDIQFFAPRTGNPRSTMQADPNAVVIFVDGSNKWIAGIMQNNKHIAANGNSMKYIPYKGSNDPKSINTSDKFRATRAWKSDGSTMSDKTGLSSEYRISNSELFAMAHFVITPNDSEINKPKPNNQSYDPKTLSTLLQDKRREYQNKIKEMRAAKRAGSFPDDIIKAAEKILSLNSEILDWTKGVLNNPKDYKYGSVDVEKSYGSGRDRRTYSSSVLKKYINACNEVTRAEEEFKKGEKHNLGSFSEYVKDIESIIKKK